MSDTPCLLFFLKSPRAGLVKTRLAAEIGTEAALRVYRFLVARQLAFIPATWSLEIHFTPSGDEELMRKWLGIEAVYLPQVCGGLGERLAAAFARALVDRRACSALAIGGDCPGLTDRRLVEAAHALHQHEAVLGPATDGGYYLLGLRRFAPLVFQEIAWSTSTVAAQTRDRLCEAGLSFSELAEEEDVDDLASWQRCAGKFHLTDCLGHNGM